MTYADEAFKWVDTGYISVSFLSYISPVMAFVHQFSYVIPYVMNMVQILQN